MYTHTYINGISVFPAHSVLEQMSNPSPVDRPVVPTCSFMLAGRDTCYLTSVWEVGDVIRAPAAGLKHTCQLLHLEITTLSQPPSAGRNLPLNCGCAWSMLQQARTGAVVEVN